MMGSLSEPTYIVLDTHAIKHLIADEDDRRAVLEAVDRACHTLIIPDIEPEYRVHIGKAMLSLMQSLRGRLRGKFIGLDEPPPRAPEQLEDELRSHGAGRGDLIVARVAWKRAQERGALIVSNDKCFHDASPTLRAYRIEVLRVDEFISEVHEVV